MNSTPTITFLHDLWTIHYSLGLVNEKQTMPAYSFTKASTSIPYSLIHVQVRIHGHGQVHVGISLCDTSTTMIY